MTRGETLRQIEDIAARATLLRSSRIRRRISRLGRDREIREAVRRVITELERILPEGRRESEERGSGE